MAAESKNGLEYARALMDDFAGRTGLSGSKGDITRRYLWTDAFAVQAFFALSHALDAPVYHEQALKLIEHVHYILGRHRKDDEKSGWISGLAEEEGKCHPTIGGLRIGKKLPQRKPGEPFDQQLEWERDGQYFHYLTRWINTLLQAGRETGEGKYYMWAAELSKTGAKFVDETGSHMYWKMSIDLSFPLVKSMGAHDPLEGLICALSARIMAPEVSLGGVISQMERLCSGLSFFTTDPLGIGGLLLNTVRVTELADAGVELPDSILPDKLWNDSLEGLDVYSRRFDAAISAAQRLAFRECGLSLGIRVLAGLENTSAKSILPLKKLEKYKPLAEKIELFWSESNHHRFSTWGDHLDINEVTLACSLLAKYYPGSFA